VADQPLSIVNSEPLTVVQAQPLGSERTRVDTNAVGVDHDKIVHGIADWASKLPPAWQKPAAMLATFPADALASLLEMFSAPETIATAGAKPAIAGMDAIAAKTAATREALHAPADALLDATIKKVGYDPEALQLAATRMRLQAARSQTRQAQMSRQIAAAQAPEAAAPAPAVLAPAEAPPTAPPPQPGPRSVNDAMAEAVRQVQAQAKADRAAVTARGSSAPGAPTPTVAPATQSPPPPTPPTGSRPVPAGGKPSVTAAMLTQYQKLRTLGLKDAEMPTYLRLTQQGTSEAEALQTIEAMRTLSAKLPSASEVARTVADRNRTGKWRE